MCLVLTFFDRPGKHTEPSPLVAVACALRVFASLLNLELKFELPLLDVRFVLVHLRLLPFSLNPNARHTSTDVLLEFLLKLR